MTELHLSREVVRTGAYTPCHNLVMRGSGSGIGGWRTRGAGERGPGARGSETRELRALIVILSFNTADQGVRAVGGGLEGGALNEKGGRGREKGTRGGGRREDRNMGRNKRMGKEGENWGHSK